MRTLSLALFASATVLAAQTTAVPLPGGSQALKTHTVVLSGQQTSGCPIAFAARRTPDGSLVQTKNAANRHTLGLLVSLGPDLHSSHTMRQANLTLHGLDGARLLAAGSPGEGTATEELSVAAQLDHGLEYTVYAHKLTGIQSVELTSLTFADGTEWHESPANPCRITPNGFTQVGLTR